MKGSIYLLAILLLNPNALFSQLIHFKSNSYALRAEEDKNLTQIYQASLSKSDCIFYLKGHTDADGSENYNLKLSKKRAETVMKGLIKKGIASSRISIEYFGETKPLKNNAFSRRVEIEIKCYEALEEIIKKEELSSVWNLYKSIPRAGEISESFTNKSGFQKKLSDGSFVFISMNSIEGNPDQKLNVTVETFGNYNNMFLTGLSTMNQNGSLMESDGMYRIGFTNEAGRMAQLKEGNTIKIFIPVKENSSGMGQYSPVNMRNYIAWYKQSENGAENLTVNPFIKLCCCAGVYTDDCPFFFCKIKRFFSPKKNTSPAPAVNPLFSGSDACNKPDNIDIFYMINKDRLSQKFLTIQSFRQYVLKSTAAKLNKEITELIPGVDKNLYMMLEVSSYNIVNCDRFVGSDRLTETVLDIDYSEKMDARLYFKDIKSVMPAQKDGNGRLIFQNVPKGFLVTLLIVKYVEDKIFIAKEKFRIGDKISPKFKKVEIDALYDPVN